ncbi:hypothetical protein ACGF5F_32645 [Streptomyces sp. NPDC047821]|uniref:hypothetical protein n=1 Tax=Streptomyces sp. NPDC047821 TaxID=3365488 RepID=UPI0037227F79
MSDVEVNFEGPIFDGRAAQAMAAYCDDARDSIAEFGEQHALNLMGLAFRHPTGYYESRVRTELVAADTARVHDSGVVYGPWLEGVGSRNSPVTRFPGYFHWRRTKALVQARGRPIAEQVLQRHLPGMR